MGIYNCRRLFKIQYAIAIHLKRWLAIFFMISGSNEQVEKKFEYTLLNPGFHC